MNATTSRTAAEVERLIAAVPNVLQGAPSGAVKALLVRLGLTVLGRIHKAFVVKARGGTDEAGEKWKPLSPKTIAYSRRHPGVPPQKRRAAARPSWMLTKAQRAKWWDRYSHLLSQYRGDKGKAAAVAWMLAKKEGAKTLLGTYGGVEVEILRDKEFLRNSLAPGDGDVPLQVFRLTRGAVTVGTKRKWCLTHHEGTARIPQRRLWPEPAKWPESWWADLLEQLQQGVVDVILYMLQRGP